MRLLEKRRNRMKWERMFGKQNTTTAAQARDTYEATYTSELMQQTESKNNQNPFPFLPISPTEFMLDENQLNAYISYTYTELLRAVALTKGEEDTGVLGGYYHEADGLRTAETDKCFAKNETSCTPSNQNCTDYCNMFHSILASSDSIHDFLGRIPNVSRNEIFNLYEKETNYKKHFSNLFDTCRNIIVRRLTQKLTELSKDEMKFIYLGRLNNIVNVNRKIKDFEYKESEVGIEDNQEDAIFDQEGAILDKSKPWESMFMSQFFYTVLPFEDRHKLYKLNFEVMFDENNNPAKFEFKEYLKKYNFQYFFLDTIIARKDGLEYYQWNQLKSYLEIEDTIDNGIFSVGEMKSIAKWWDPSSGSPGEEKIVDYIENFSKVLRTEVLQTCNKVQFIKIAKINTEETTILSPNGKDYSDFFIEIKIVNTSYYIKIPKNSFTIENCISMYAKVSSLDFSSEVKDDLKLFILSLKRSGDHGQTMYLKHFNKTSDEKAFLITGDSLCAVKALYEKQPVLFFKYYMDYSTNDQKVDIFLYNSEEKYESKTCYNYIILNKLEDYIDTFDSIKDKLNDKKLLPYFDSGSLKVNHKNTDTYTHTATDTASENMNILYKVKLFDDLVKFGDNLLKGPVPMEVENNPPQENAQFNTNTSIKYFEEDLNLNDIETKVLNVEEIKVEVIRAKIKQRIQEENNNRMAKFVRQSKRIKQQAENVAVDKVKAQKEHYNEIVVMDILKEINEYLIEGIYHVDNLVLYLNMYFELLEKFENEKDKETIKNIFKDNINTITQKKNYTKYFSKLFKILSNEKLKLKKSEPNHGSSKLLAERLVVLSSLIYKCVKPVGAAADATSINDLKKYNLKMKNNSNNVFSGLEPLVGLDEYPLLMSLSDEQFFTLYNNGIKNFIDSDSDSILNYQEPATQTPQPPQTPTTPTPTTPTTTPPTTTP